MSGRFAGVGSMQFDTDVLISSLRGLHSASDAIDAAEDRSLSIISYMELIQGARDKRAARAIKSFLADLRFQTFPLTENIGHRALVYLEQHASSIGLELADAIIAATAVENAERLLTANVKHYKPIQELELVVFKP